jgi:D-alanyl-lipoteichoic acid acyltransferase DltB (MBOAT superfamily)
MLFNSYAFIVVFLPLALAGFFLLGRIGPVWGAAWLVLCSFGFYGYWNPRYLPLLGGSILFNYACGRRLAARPGALLLAASVTANLACLAYFKYANFFLDNLNAATGIGWSLAHVVLPLGISFFTFTQIAYLVDARRGHAKEASLLHYALFVTYFPHLIAGPILHHGEMMPQFRSPAVFHWHGERFCAGLAAFAMGLTKKVVLADAAAGYAVPAFAALGHGHAPALVEAWGGALSYTFQLYFDFSGYCDMAIGISWMFGIGLPLNFNSPYQSRSIIDFWRRWHMTLSRFLRDYLYISLGGNRHGTLRRYINLGATMVIGGLWHGAGWTFVIWGALHGAYLMVNHAWVGWRGASSRPGGVWAWAVTFLAVVIAWVFFRAASVPDALRMLGGMAGLHGFVRPGEIVAAPLWAWCGLLAAISFALPNTEAILRDVLPAMAVPPGRTGRLRFMPTVGWAVGVGLLLAAGLAALPQPTSFLYFNF